MDTGHAIYQNASYRMDLTPWPAQETCFDERLDIKIQLEVSSKGAAPATLAYRSRTHSTEAR
jgi:hypothetical protein